MNRELQASPYGKRTLTVTCPCSGEMAFLYECGGCQWFTGSTGQTGHHYNYMVANPAKVLCSFRRD